MKLTNQSLGGQQDDVPFEVLFKTHYKALHAYAMVILKDEDDAEWDERRRVH